MLTANLRETLKNTLKMVKPNHIFCLLQVFLSLFSWLRGNARGDKEKKGTTSVSSYSFFSCSTSLQCISILYQFVHESSLFAFRHN